MVLLYKEVIKLIKYMSNTNTIPPGQLSIEERKYLKNVVTTFKPNLLLESGTWFGGGSTLSLVEGLYENKKGILHTVEEVTGYYTVANNFYKNSKYLDFIKLHNSSFISFINTIDLSEIDLIFLDGGDEAPDGKHKLELKEYLKDYNCSENVQSFKIIEERIKPNTHVILHDWNDVQGRGNFVKRYLEKEDKMKYFKIHNCLNITTGLMHLIKI